jgi:hypothetical protein
VSWITLRQDSDESANLALRSHAIGGGSDDDADADAAENEDEQIEEKEPATDDELADATHDVAVDTTTDHAHLETAAAAGDDEAAAAMSRKKRRTRREANEGGDGGDGVDDDEAEEKKARRKAALEARRAKRARKARDARLAAEKGLPTEPFIFSLKNLWDKPPTQIFTRQRGDKNGVLVHGTERALRVRLCDCACVVCACAIVDTHSRRGHCGPEYYGPLWGSGFDLGILGHPHESPPSAWCVPPLVFF